MVKNEVHKVVKVALNQENKQLVLFNLVLLETKSVHRHRIGQNYLLRCRTFLAKNVKL